MNNSTILKQLLETIPRYEFTKLVDKYQTDKWTKKLKSWGHLVIMAYAQLRQRDSLRGIETGLDCQSNKLYHLGIGSAKRSTIADANNNRDYRIFEELFYKLLEGCNRVARRKMKIPKQILLLDSTMIQLCYSLFDWAKYRTRKGAIKLHYLFDLEAYLPQFIQITDGKVGDITAARQFNISPDSILVMDRAYVDYQWWHELHQQGTTFVIRAKKDLSYTVLGQHPIPEGTSVVTDEDIVVPWRAARRPDKYSDCPVPLRLVSVVDQETGEVVRFLTNNETYSADTISLLYKLRWNIEIFFKWIKQNLKIKSFLGTTENAVFTQIWIAMIVYLLVWFLRIQTQCKLSLLILTRSLNELLLDRRSILDILAKPIQKINSPPILQLNLF